MRACWLKWVGRDWSLSADYIWLNYSDANIFATSSSTRNSALIEYDHVSAASQTALNTKEANSVIADSYSSSDSRYRRKANPVESTFLPTGTYTSKSVSNLGNASKSRHGDVNHKRNRSRGEQVCLGLPNAQINHAEIYA